MTLYKKPQIKELTPQERAFVVAFKLAEGRELTTEQVAEMTGGTIRSAQRLMNRGSRVTPIYRSNGIWRRMK